MSSKLISPDNREDLAGKTPEEAFKILCEEGAELTEEQLAQIAGGRNGSGWGYVFCDCGWLNYAQKPTTSFNCVHCGKLIKVYWPD